MGSTVAAVVGSFVTLLVALLAWLTSERARRTQKQTDENASALAAWRDLVTPLREEVARERGERARLEGELETVQAELRQLQEGQAG